MNEKFSAGIGVDTEAIKTHQSPIWRNTYVVLGIVAIVAFGLLITTRSTNPTVWVRLLGHHFELARGGIPATIAPTVLLLIGVVIPAWAIINAMRTPKGTFASLGRSKSRWVVSMIILFLIGDASLLLVPIYYLLRVRPQLNRVQAAARF
ncbi:MAG: hypothetical protein HIU84_07815 [Acidobacteria bacterium]|nr:hypothetical protein [Acidobacteriota bacterium]